MQLGLPKMLFLAALAALFVTAGFFGYRYYDDAVTYIELKREFSDFISPDVSIGGSSFVINSGARGADGSWINPFTELAVLRIAHFAALARIDPILGLAGADTDQLLKTIAALKSATEQIAATYEEADAAVVREHLYPFAFLDTLAGLENARRSLIETPSREQAERYHQELVQSLRAYRDAARKAAAYIEQSQEPGVAVTFRFPGGDSSPTHLVAQLRTMAREADARLAEAEARYQCVTGAGACDQPLLSEALASLTPDEEVGVVLETKLPAHIERNYGIQQIQQSLFSDVSNRTYFEGTTMVTTADSHCIPAETPIYYSPWKLPVLEVPVFRIVEVNDIYFRDLSEASIRGHELFQNVRQGAGVPYITQSPSVTYSCPDSGYPLSLTSTFLSVRETLRKAPVAAEMRDVDGWNVLQALEENLTNAPVLREENVAAYMHTLGSLLESQGEAALAARIGAENVFRIEELLGRFKQRSSMYPAVLGDIVFISNLFVINTGLGSEIYPRTLFNARGGQLITYLGFNRSLISKPVSLMRSKAKNLDAFNLISFNEELSKIHTTDAEIRQLVLDSFEAHKFLQHR